MNNEQKKFLNELARLFEKYNIIVHLPDKGFELKIHEEFISFQSYKDGTFFNVRTYKSEYDTTKEKETE